MFLRWCHSCLVVAVAAWALPIFVPASAQDSFLDEFSEIQQPQSPPESVRRPVFLSSPYSGSEFDSLGDDVDADPGGPPNGAFDEQPPLIYSDSPEVDDICAEPEYDAIPDCDIPLVRFRDGCYQGSQLNYGYVNDDPISGLAIRTLDTYATFAVPLGSMENVITLTPFFRADMLDAAAILDVPDILYETGVKALWRRPVNERFSTMLLLTPSVRSDFATSDGAFRLFGMALLSWKKIPDKLVLSGGAVYTGRQDYPVLPAMGLLWTPSPQWKFDIQFPSPRISYRLLKDGASSETWAYLSGVFGGNTWAVTRASGVPDMLTISDLRFVSGVEHLLAGNLGIFLELGYVFDRQLEYTDVPVTRELDSTWMVRTGISF